MPDPITAVVRARGMHRGTALLEEGSLGVLDEGIVLAVGQTTITATYGELEGLTLEPPLATLYFVGGDVLELEGDSALDHAAAEIVNRSCSLPELTRALHGLGSRRARPGSEHNRFFDALMRARREAEGCADVVARLAAFPALAIAGDLERTMREFAAERFPDSAPDRRALEAELMEQSERLLSRLADLGGAADRVRASGPAMRFVAWREWTAFARAVFEEADRCWLSSADLLAHLPVTPKRRRARKAFWIRVLKLRAIVLA